MPRILSKIAKKLGLVAVHVVVVRQRRGAFRILESSFPPDNTVDVRLSTQLPISELTLLQIDVHLSVPYEKECLMKEAV